MLHRINLPECARHLDWIVNFQADLLHALCDPDLSADDVTVEWVKDQRSDIDSDWLEHFCGWQKNKKNIIRRMQEVADLTRAEKQSLVTHYENNLRYAEAFGDAPVPPPSTQPLPGGMTNEAVEAYRNFFEMFYAPVLYKDKGYLIEAIDLEGETFNKDKYLDFYHAANPGLKKICPLCDGSMDGAEVDHWLAKKHLPELNCHPQNLVEICSACNSSTNKGSKLAMDIEEPEPFYCWFHPHLRPALDSYDVLVDENKVLKLVSDDPLTQTRLDKLNLLINLKKRWAAECQRFFRSLELKLRRHYERSNSPDAVNLKEKLRSWKDEAEDAHGIDYYAIVHKHFLELVLEPDSDFFRELLQFVTNEIPTTP